MPESPERFDERLELPADRVRNHTAQLVNQRIAERTRDRIERVVREGRDGIVRRLAQLDHEWDVDRTLMVNFAVAAGVAHAANTYRQSRRVWFGRRRGSRWLFVLTAQLGFLLLYGTLGWCPPLAVHRRLGVRTRSEIEAERRMLLNALRAQPALAS
jgi:hypothetical protein